MPRSLVQNFMSHLTVSTSLESRVDEAEKLLWSSKVSNIYVVDLGGELVGVVPDYDFLKWRSLNCCNAVTISSIMSPISTTLSVNDSIERAVSLLCENIHSSVPVVDQKKLVGVVNRRCVAFGLFELQQQAEPDRDVLEGKLNHGAIAAPKFLQTGEIGRSRLGDSRNFPLS